MRAPTPLPSRNWEVIYCSWVLTPTTDRIDPLLLIEPDISS
jgi:hypothetical protein